MEKLHTKYISSLKIKTLYKLKTKSKRLKTGKCSYNKRVSRATRTSNL